MYGTLITYDKRTGKADDLTAEFTLRERIALNHQVARLVVVERFGYKNKHKIIKVSLLHSLNAKCGLVYVPSLAHFFLPRVF